MNSKKELNKAFEKLIEDIMDNYDKYTDEDKRAVESLYNNALSLNDRLEHYDKKPTAWEKFKIAFNNFFGKKWWKIKKQDYQFGLKLLFARYLLVVWLSLLEFWLD